MNKNKYKEFTITSFKKITSKENLTNIVKLKINNNLFTSSGELTIDKSLAKGKIKINLYKILKKNDYQEKKEFEIINNIYHETEHAKTLTKTKEHDFYSYEQLISLMELIYYANMFNLDFNKLSCTGNKILKLKKIINKNYEVSGSELNANLVGYKKAYEKYINKLNEYDQTLIKKIIYSIELLSENMEICYDHIGGCHNKFSLFLVHTAAYIRKFPKVYETYQILQHLFNQDGTVKKFNEIYTNMNDQNSDMYKKILIHHLISIKEQYNELVDQDDLKKFLEHIITNYIDSSIEYFKNINICKIFVDNPKCLTDNLSMKKKNIEVLSKVIHQYDLDLKTGLLIGNSSIGSQKTLFKC